MEKPLSDLIEIIHFTEIVSAKIHGVLDKAEIFRILKEQFKKSKRYTASILLLTDEGLKLRVAETSLFPGKLKAGEKAAGVKIKGYKIDLNKSSIFSQVVREGKTVQANVSDILAELFPRPLAYLTSKTLGFENKSSILTPLKQNEKIIGTFAMSSTELTEYFIPSVKSLAQHISSALALADECDERKKVEQELRESEERYRDLINTSVDGVISVDPELKIILWNPGAERIFGYTKEEIQGQSLMRIVPKSFRKAMKKGFDEFRKSGSGPIIGKTLELEGVRKDRTEIAIELSVSSRRVDETYIATAIVRDITERKQAEETLHDAKEKWISLTENTNDIITIIDSKGIIQYINRTIPPYTPEKTIGKMIYEYTPKESDIVMRKSLRKVFKTGEEDSFEISSNIPKIGTLWFSTKVVPIKIDSKIVNVIMIARDITERKKAEKVMRESREEYISVTNLTGDIIVKIDKKGKWTFLNDGACEFWGKPKEKLLGVEFVKYLHPDDAEKTNATVQKTIKTKQIIKGLINRQKTPKGWRMVEWNATPIFDDAGNYTGMQATGRDITERKQAEEALRESEEKYKVLVESAADLIYMIDKKNKVLSVNKAAAGAFGKEPKEIIGKSIFDLFPEEIATNYSKSLKNVFETGRSVSSESRMVIRGRESWNSVSLSPVRNHEGRVVAVMGVTRDITERKRMETELISSHKKLRELSSHLIDLRENERKSFSHAIHDDLGQLLTVLKMDLSRLYEKLLPSQKPLQGMTKSLIEHAEKTMEVVQRISTELRPKLLDDVGLIPAIKWQVKEFQNRTGIRCNLNIIPQHIHLDNDLDTTIFRILQEGLTNVARHANATRIEVNLKEKNSKLMLKIRDNGKGITKKQISDPKSFGLMGIQERILSWEGKFEIKGIKDKGTTITINLPLEKSEIP